jgi:hypothetical protein
MPCQKCKNRDFVIINTASNAHVTQNLTKPDRNQDDIGYNYSHSINQ